MSVVWGFIFDKLTDPLGLPLPLWQQWLILGIIGFVAYIVAYRIVGEMYDGGWIDFGFSGSLFHWLIRLCVFVVFWAVTYAVIAFVKFVYAYWVTSLIVAASLIIIEVAIWLIRRKKVPHA